MALPVFVTGKTQLLPRPISRLTLCDGGMARCLPVQTGERVMAGADFICGGVANGVRERLWMEARCFYSRERAQSRCWLWLLRTDGRIDAIHLPAQHFGDDARLPALVGELDAQPQQEHLVSTLFGDIVRLRDAPAVPMPRWAISWGHPAHQRLRAFAQHLDATTLHVLGELEAPGPFLGSVENYNRLASLPAQIRERRMQALLDFPPLVVPLLLRAHGWPSLLPDQYENHTPPARPPTYPPAVLHAIDHGRDLIGALAAHYRVGRALVRSKPMRTPWANLDEVRGVLRFLDAIPAHARPETRLALETWWPAAQALPVSGGEAEMLAILGNVFAKGWQATWQSTGLSAQEAPLRLRDCRDFLAAAARELVDSDPSRDIDTGMLGAAWLARRGLRSLVQASRRWHAQPMVPSTAPNNAINVAALPAILGEYADAGRHASERLTASALVAEGQAMAHCVGDYWPRCERGGDRILRLSLADGEQATAHFMLAGVDVDGPRYSLADIRGLANTESSPGMWSWAEQIEQVLNAPERDDARRQALTHARVCTRQASASRSGWVRPFDRTSRRELGQVIAWLHQHQRLDSRGDVLLEDEVAGAGYAAAADHLADIVAGDPLQLVREPANPHDPNAIRIEWHGHKLGYVPRRSNAGLARLLDRGKLLDTRLTCIVSGARNWPIIEFRVSSLIDDVEPSAR